MVILYFFMLAPHRGALLFISPLIILIFTATLNHLRFVLPCRDTVKTASYVAKRDRQLIVDCTGIDIGYASFGTHMRAEPFDYALSTTIFSTKNLICWKRLLPSAGFKPWTSCTNDRHSRPLDCLGTIILFLLAYGVLFNLG